MGRPKKPYDTQSRTYDAWSDMKSRCLNPRHQAFARYGGRGLTFCKRWASYEKFLADMGEKPEGLTLERIDNSKGYSPANCRWATYKEQLNNKRNNRRIKFNGVTLTVTQWAEKIGIPRFTLFARLRAGWSIAKALNIAVHKYKQIELTPRLIAKIKRKRKAGQSTRGIAADLGLSRAAVIRTLERSPSQR